MLFRSCLLLLAPLGALLGLVGFGFARLADVVSARMPRLARASLADLPYVLLASPALAEGPPAKYVPAPAEQIPGYSDKVLPCKVVHGLKDSTGAVQPRSAASKDPNVANYVTCEAEPFLENKSLRELSLLRNTIYARYGWAGFRKPWLREYFQKQPWYKPDESFTQHRLSGVDRRNVVLIAQAEMSLRMVDLEERRDTLLARAGKAWGDAPVRREGAKKVPDCSLDTSNQSKDCKYHQGPHEAAAADFSKLSPEDNIELGLISRAMGDFAVDDGQREQLATSLDTVLSVKDLRQLSLRDLRLLRNTLFARRGRPFKSELLREHFSQMPWYKPDPAYTDARLTKTDKINIELIRQVEEEFGGALKDQDYGGNPSEARDQDIPVAVQA